MRYLCIAFLAGFLLACGTPSAISPTTTPASPTPIGTIEDVTSTAISLPEPTATVAPAATPTAEPSPTIEPSLTAEQTVTPVPTEPATATAPLQSGGLGLTRSEWEQLHGTGTQDPVMGYSYEDGEYLVSYQADPAGVETVWGIEQRLGGSGMSVDDARAVSTLLLPRDQALKETYTSATGTLVDLYRSEWLKDRFPATMKIGKIELSMWTEGEPGDFIVLYRADGGNATSIVIGIGNNP